MENPDEELIKLRMINENLQKLLDEKQKTISLLDKLIAEYREEIISLRQELHLVMVSFSKN